MPLALGHAKRQAFARMSVIKDLYRVATGLRGRKKVIDRDIILIAKLRLVLETVQVFYEGTIL